MQTLQQGASCKQNLLWLLGITSFNCYSQSPLKAQRGTENVKYLAGRWTKNQVRAENNLSEKPGNTPIMPNIKFTCPMSLHTFHHSWLCASRVISSPLSIFRCLSVACYKSPLKRDLYISVFLWFIHFYMDKPNLPASFLCPMIRLNPII